MTVATTSMESVYFVATALYTHRETLICRVCRVAYTDEVTVATVATEIPLPREFVVTANVESFRDTRTSPRFRS
jgi:hypothetical protein